jgi:hypothetical protein
MWVCGKLFCGKVPGIVESFFHQYKQKNTGGTNPPGLWSLSLDESGSVFFRLTFSAKPYNYPTWIKKT